MNKIIITLLLVGGLFLSSFQKKNINDVVACTIAITSVNDSTFVIQNNSNPYSVENRVILGNPTIVQIGDTIQISGNMYSVSIIATDTNNCLAQKVINKY